MKNQILTFVLSALVVVGVQFTSLAASAQSVTAVNGNVTISCEVLAPENTPVSILIMPAIYEGEDDVTVAKVAEIDTPAELSALAPEYIAIVKVNGSGRVEHECQVKSSLPTGLCHVIINYYGSLHSATKGFYSAGVFEHVGVDDLNDLVSAFNTADAVGYDAIIDKDINGTTEPFAAAKEILKKSSADVAYYSTLSDDAKLEFNTILFDMKPATGFGINSLILSFNKSVAWMQLLSESDTMFILNAYNSKYWNLSLDVESDFYKMSADEQIKLLSAIKAAKYVKASDLEQAFSDGVVLGIFRSLSEADRDGLRALISADGSYSAYFSNVRNILAAAGLNEYQLSVVYNTVLKGKSGCNSKAEIEQLFKDSLPERDISGGSGSSISARGGFSGSGSGYTSPVPNLLVKNKFVDVPKEHWAYDYVQRLSDIGAVNGVGNDEFAPTLSVKRQDFVKILIGVLGIEPSASNSVFGDIAGNYSESYVMAAFENGLVNGTADGIFGGNNSITREDAAVIISRVLNLYDINVNAKTAEFNDSNSIADYAKEAVSTLISAGIFKGDDTGNFCPKAELSRAEACAILCRLVDLIKGV